jgi:hypothetical protein
LQEAFNFEDSTSVKQVETVTVTATLQIESLESASRECHGIRRGNPRSRLASLSPSRQPSTFTEFDEAANVCFVDDAGMRRILEGRRLNRTPLLMAALPHPPFDGGPTAPPF